MLGMPEHPAGAEGFHQEREAVAQVLERLPDGVCRLVLKNRFFAGDALELMRPAGIVPFTAVPFVREDTGELLETYGVGGAVIRMRLPDGADRGDWVRGPVRNHRV